MLFGRSKNCNELPATPASGIKRKRADGLAGGGAPIPVKRERTVTWAGKTRPLAAAQSFQNGKTLFTTAIPVLFL